MVHVTTPFMGCGDKWARHLAGDLWVLLMSIEAGVFPVKLGNK